MHQDFRLKNILHQFRGILGNTPQTTTKPKTEGRQHVVKRLDFETLGSRRTVRINLPGYIKHWLTHAYQDKYVTL